MIREYVKKKKKCHDSRHLSCSLGIEPLFRRLTGVLAADGRFVADGGHVRPAVAVAAIVHVQVDTETVSAGAHTVVVVELNKHTRFAITITRGTADNKRDESSF